MWSAEVQLGGGGPGAGGPQAQTPGYDLSGHWDVTPCMMPSVNTAEGCV